MGRVWEQTGERIVWTSGSYVAGAWRKTNTDFHKWHSSICTNLVAEYLELVTACTSCLRGSKFWMVNVIKSDNWKTKKYISFKLVYFFMEISYNLLVGRLSEHGVLSWQNSHFTLGTSCNCEFQDTHTYIYIYIYIYTYNPRFVTVCFTTIHSDEDFENGKPKILKIIKT